jgi:DeoR family transcriptional regulator of aga operon
MRLAETMKKKTGDDNAANAPRVELILQELLREGEISVELLANKLKVSSATIRRDLMSLEQQGLLLRTHGGATPVEPALYEPFRHVSSFSEQEQQRTFEKRRIGLAAAELINDGDTIAFGAGTTTTQVARSIRHRHNLTVLTNAINIAMELSHRDDIKVFVTGGELSGAWFALVGATAQRHASEMFVDKAIIGVDGIHATHGLTTNYPDQAAIHRTLLQQARERIVVADHRKIGHAATALIWHASDINTFITDKKAGANLIKPFTDQGIEVIRA